jgi:hypothetical protein
MKYFCFLILIFPCFFKAQTDSIKSGVILSPNEKIIDSLTKKLTKDSTRIYRFQTIRPFLDFDNRNSVINGKPVNFRGIQLGITLNERNTFGLGFYNVGQESKKPIATLDGTVSAQRTVIMKYMTFFYYYSFIEKRYFELNMPLEIGLGNYEINFADPATRKIYRTQKGGMVPIGIGLQAVLKPTKWFGISLLVGYRYVAQKDVNQHFNGPYSALGLTFEIRQIHRDIRYYWIKKKHYRKEVKRLLNN